MYKKYTEHILLVCKAAIFKYFLIMKLVFFLLLVTILHVNAAVLAQKINLSKKNTPLVEVLKEVRTQSGYNILSTGGAVKNQQIIAINLANASIEEAMNKILQGLDLTYKIVEKNIVVSKESKDSRIIQQNTIVIAGKVKDENGEPLAGVSIRAKGGQAGSITDINGNYKINVPNRNTILIFNYLGFSEQEKKVGDNDVMNIILKIETAALNEIVVIGYGEVKREDLTGAVSSVKVKDIENIPVTRVDQMLQGRIAGAEIVSTSGEPGAATSIRIRGTRSITATNEPLYVIDGVIDGISDLNELNPSDIASIEVLKDASSTAIYGSRGSNGVILITTKQGDTGGKTNFTFSSGFGFSQLPKYLDLMNAQEFAEVINDRRYLLSDANKIIPLEGYNYPDPYSLGEGTNWTKEIAQTGGFQNHTFSASGGDNKTRFFFSSNYNESEGIIINSGLKRKQVRLNLDRTINKFVKAGLRLNYSNLDQELNKASFGTSTLWYSSAIFLAPTMPAYKEDGSFNDWNTQWSGGTLFDSPIANAVLRKRSVLKKTLFSNFFIEATPLKNFKIKTSFSYNDLNRFEDNFTPSTMPTRANRGSGANAFKGANREDNFLSENTISYANTWAKKHKFDVMYGFTYQHQNFIDMTMRGDGYLVDFLETNDMGALPSKENLTVSSNYEDQTRMSHILRMNYNYQSKYYLTVTGRADGGSNFSALNKWGYFPSAAFKWNIKKEEFMSGFRDISNLSLRLSAGLTGNDAIARYKSLSMMRALSTGYIFDGVIPVSYNPSRLGNEDLTWEKTFTLNAGLDISFLRNKVNVTLDAYSSKTNDLLLTVQLPRGTGYDSRIANIGKTENKGIELAIETKNITGRKFSWSSTVTLAHNKQMVVDIGGLDYVSVYNNNWGAQYMMYGYVQGRPLNALWGMQYAGVWKSEEEVNQNKIDKKYASNSAEKYYSPGRAKYIDQNSDGILDNNDLVYLGNADPDLYGGVQNRFTLGKVDFSIYFNYSIGGKIYNPTELFMGTGAFHSNQYRYMIDRWHPIRNPNSNIPSADSKDDIPNDRFVHSASFLRLKNISLGYTFDLAKKTKNVLKTLSLSANGNNVFLWKKYNGYDPEVSTESGSSTIRRMDNGAYPSSRTISFSANLKF